ncbi:MAG: hypothetical protein Q7J42_04965, partial [Sulfuritalea sp.]|nr:hypothetical protein [Sulfuritalea sp.]
LVGNAGADTFTLSAGVTFGGTIDGAAGTDELKATDGTNAWAVTGGDAGTFNTNTVFSNIEMLTGGSGDDTFTLANLGTVSGNIVGGGQTLADTLNLSAKVGAVSINQELATATGITGTFTQIEAVVGNDAGATTTSTITGVNAGQTFNVTGANSGTAGTLAFAQVGNLVGGTGADTFTGTGAGSLSGALADGGGATTLGGTIQTVGDQIYTGAVTLNAATTLTSTGSGAINFGSTVDGGQTLAVNTAGVTTFGGIVGATPLTSVTTDLPGTTVIAGGSVTTTGAQTYNDPVSGAATITLTSTAAGGHITATNATNDFTTLSVNTTGASDVFVNDTDAVILGASTVGGYLDITAGGDITQTGLLTIGGDLWAMSSGNILLTSSTNALSGTVSLIAGAASQVWLNATRIEVGLARPSDLTTTNVGISAATVILEAPSGGAFITAAGTAGGLVTATAPFSPTTASLTIRTLPGNGVIGNLGFPVTQGLNVRTSGLVRVFGDALGTGTIHLVGDDAVQPKYEFSGDPLHRSVKYNGVEATNAQLTGALDAAYLDIRNATIEIRESGFAKENANKVLRRGVVTSAGPGQPAVDDSTGTMGLASCDGNFRDSNLACQQ